MFIMYWKSGIEKLTSHMDMPVLSAFCLKVKHCDGSSGGWPLRLRTRLARGGCGKLAKVETIPCAQERKIQCLVFLNFFLAQKMREEIQMSVDNFCHIGGFC